MAISYSVYYEIRDKNVGLYDFIKEKEVPHLVEDLKDYLTYGGDANYDVESIIESEDLFSKISKIFKDNNYQYKEHKIIDLIMASNVLDGSDLEGYSGDWHLGYTDLNDKYLLFKRYFVAFKKELIEPEFSVIDPAPSLIEEGDPNILDSYLEWLEDLYKEINPKSNVPELSKDMLKDLNFGSGEMGPSEYALGYTESGYDHNLKEALPSIRFDFKPNNEVSFKTRIKDILLNKNIFYTYSWW